MLLNVMKLFSYLNFQTAWTNHPCATTTLKLFFCCVFFFYRGHWEPWIEKYLIHISKDAHLVGSVRAVLSLIWNMKAPGAWCCVSVSSQSSLRIKYLEGKKIPCMILHSIVWFTVDEYIPITKLQVQCRILLTLSTFWLSSVKADLKGLLY